MEGVVEGGAPGETRRGGGAREERGSRAQPVACPGTPVISLLMCPHLSPPSYHRSLLHIVSLVKSASASSSTLLGSGAMAAAASVPEHWACSAVSALLELEGRQLVEGGMADIVLPIARNLKALPVGGEGQGEVGGRRAARGAQGCSLEARGRWGR